MNIGSLKIQPGSKTRGFIEMPDYDGPLRVRFPVLAACGTSELPLVTLTAAQHGREVQGIEVIRRVFESLDIKNLRGTVMALPVANPLAVRMWVQDYPSELGRYGAGTVMGVAHNFNRHWPGSADGTLHERMCHTLWNSVIRHSSFHIDLHGWTDNSLGIAWANPANRQALNSFSYPVSRVNPPLKEAKYNCLDEVCELAGIPWITVELPPQNRLWEKSVYHGVRGVMNVLKHLNMLDGPLDLEPHRYFITPDSVEHKFVAKEAGLVSSDVPLGTMLAKGQRFGAVYSLDTLEPIQELVAPEAGLLFNVGVHICECLNPTSIAAPGLNVALVKEIVEIL